MNEILDILRDEIKLIVKQEVAAYIKTNKYEKPYNGTVKEVSTDGTTAIVDLKFVELANLKNKTGESLAKNDAVIVYAIGGNINNSYIGLKF